MLNLSSVKIAEYKRIARRIKDSAVVIGKTTGKVVGACIVTGAACSMAPAIIGIPLAVGVTIGSIGCIVGIPEAISKIK